MKTIIIFMFLAFSTQFSFVQAQYSGNQNLGDQSGLIMTISKEKSCFNDTLWVVDSVLLYKVVDNILSHRETYRVTKRNEYGNKVTTINEGNKDFLGTPILNTFDSIVYFDGEILNKKFSYVFDNPSESWLQKTYWEFEAPNVFKEDISKYYSQNLQQFVSGFHELRSNSEGKADTILFQTYNVISDTWSNESNLVYHYDGNNDTLIMVYHWKNNMWVDSAMHRQNFESGNLVQRDEYIFSNSTWKIYRRHHFSYTISGQVDTTQILLWDEIAENWIVDFEQIVTYGENDEINNILILVYDYVSGQLQNHQNTAYIYQPESKMEINTNWDKESESWVNSYKVYSSFIVEDIIDTVQIDYWNENTTQWEPNTMRVVRFDKRMNDIDRTQYLFNDSQWELDYKTDYYWSPFIPNATHEIQANTLAVYPNPATTQVSFVVPDNQANSGQQALLTIFDLSGRQMTQLPLQDGKAAWDCAGVKAGLYVYSLSGSGASVSGKVVVR